MHNLDVKRIASTKLVWSLMLCWASHCTKLLHDHTGHEYSNSPACCHVTSWCAGHRSVRACILSSCLTHLLLQLFRGCLEDWLCVFSFCIACTSYNASPTSTQPSRQQRHNPGRLTNRDWAAELCKFVLFRHVRQQKARARPFGEQGLGRRLHPPNGRQYNRSRCAPSAEWEAV